MASYKVPQDVEADDKLIGPFSFRQFIYLLIIAMACALAWALSQIFIGLAILPLPIIVFFGALALPLRKDQPMEIYMAAMVSYFLKPRKRFWDPEGVETLIEITAPKVVEVRRTKDLSQNEAEQRLSYLANIVDSGGWAIRGVTSATSNTSMNNDLFMEAQNATDILDTNNSVAHSFDQMMSQSTARMHEEARERMMQATAPTPEPAFSPTQSQNSFTQTSGQTFNPAPSDDLVIPEFNPYLTFHQSVIQPLNDVSHHAKSDIKATKKSGDKAQTLAYHDDSSLKENETPKDTSDTQLTADIINLANNPDLSIETIAHEAHRIHKKAEQESEEVVISLR